VPHAQRVPWWDKCVQVCEWLQSLPPPPPPSRSLFGWGGRRNGRIVARTSAPLCRSYTHAHIQTRSLRAIGRAKGRDRVSVVGGIFRTVDRSLFSPPHKQKLSKFCPFFPPFYLHSRIFQFPFSLRSAPHGTGVSVKSANYHRVVWLVKSFKPLADRFMVLSVCICFIICAGFEPIAKWFRNREIISAGGTEQK